MKYMNLKVGQMRRSSGMTRYAFIVEIDEDNERIHYYYMDDPNVIHDSSRYSFEHMFL